MCTGARNNLTTLALLLGMMLFCKTMEREQMVQRLLARLITRKMSTASLLFRISFVTYWISAIFTNDATCLMLTPLVLHAWRSLKRSFLGVYLLLAHSFSANLLFSSTYL